VVAEKAGGMTVCLNMIVRNEAHVIRRCLLSHKDVIDHWVIVDTGSTDGTQDLIRKLLADIPGELHERPWVDFGHNRSEALNLARGKANYILVNDADHIWHGKLPKHLTADAYAVPYHYAGTVYGVTCVLADRIPGWRYVGVIHEYVDAQQPIKIEPASDAWIEVKHEGARSLDPHTYEKDVKILEAAFEQDPQNPRYAFYLAQSYRDSNESEKALLMYLKRAEMPGWDQETWHAKYQAAIMTERLGRAPETISRAYLEAYNFRPSRAEPLAHLARWHRSRSEWPLAYLYAARAANIPRSTDGLFVEEGIYEWQALDELTVAAWYAGHKGVGRHAAKTLLKRKYPPQEKQRFEANLAWYAAKPLDKHVS
jgi:glycosyltransferase involved in cell wall biosynthesis